MAEPSPLGPPTSARLEIVPDPPPEPSWSPFNRVVFRLAFIFFALELIPFPLGALPKTDSLAEAVSGFESAVTVWVGHNLLGIVGPILEADTGSGDRTIDYVWQLMVVVVALVGGIIWSVADRRRSSYATLDRGLRVWLRFFLANALFIYGFLKLFPTQMPFSYSRLLEPYGQSSPMGLLWSFLGNAPAYERFAGGAEVLAGLLLVFRRTSGLGALLTLGVMGNVVAMNFTYDVPVKLYSSLLWLTALFLALPDLGRLARLFFLSRSVTPSPSPGSRRRSLVLGLVGLAFGAAFLVGRIVDGYSGYTTWGNGRPEPSIAGLYDVRELVRDGNLQPPLGTEPHRYIRFAIDGLFAGTVEANGRFTRFTVKLDEEHRALGLRTRAGEIASALAWTADPDGALTLEGVLEGSVVRMRLARADMQKELLVSRGFHWVTERPFNR